MFSEMTSHIPKINDDTPQKFQLILNPFRHPSSSALYKKEILKNRKEMRQASIKGPKKCPFCEVDFVNNNDA